MRRAFTMNSSNASSSCLRYLEDVLRTVVASSSNMVTARPTEGLFSECVRVRTLFNVMKSVECILVKSEELAWIFCGSAPCYFNMELLFVECFGFCAFKIPVRSAEINILIIRSPWVNFSFKALSITHRRCSCGYCTEWAGTFPIRAGTNVTSRSQANTRL